MEDNPESRRLPLGCSSIPEWQKHNHNQVLSGQIVRSRTEDPLSSFGKKYSKYYDMLYADKDYDKECDYLELLFEEFASRKVRRILDVACGTGGHTRPPAGKGVTVGVKDASSQKI